MDKKRQEHSFKKEDLVWAKVRGFPYWPGIVKNFFEEKK
jgi:hypothetical protein